MYIFCKNVLSILGKCFFCKNSWMNLNQESPIYSKSVCISKVVWKYAENFICCFRKIGDVHWKTSKLEAVELKFIIIYLETCFKPNEESFFKEWNLWEMYLEKMSLAIYDSWSYFITIIICIMWNILWSLCSISVHIIIYRLYYHRFPEINYKRLFKLLQ